MGQIQIGIGDQMQLEDGRLIFGQLTKLDQEVRRPILGQIQQAQGVWRAILDQMLLD